MSISAADGTRNFHLAAVNVTGTGTGTYPVSAGNPNNATATWVDGTGNFTSNATGAGGTITFSMLQLGRVAGSLNINMRVIGGTGTGVTLAGTFDIPYP